MKKLILAGCVLFTATLLATSCGKKSGAMTYQRAGGEMNSSMAFDSADMAFEDSKSFSSSQETPAQTERKLIKRGSISLEVQSLAEAEAGIKKWCTSLGGYVESSTTGLNDGSFSVRIPSNNFERAMDSAGDLGKIKSKNSNSEDVTETFYDLQSRLDTKKILRDRLQNYLKEAQNIEDMLKIERELNSVISDIESMETRMKHLSGQIDYSQIQIYYDLPYRASEGQSFTMPDFGRGFRRFIYNVLDFLINFLQVILYVIVFGAPIIIAIAFFYWLLFGKLGLLKRLFRRLSGKNK